MAIVKQIAESFRESMTGILYPVGLEFDNIVAQVNSALRGIGTWQTVPYLSTNFVGLSKMVWTTQAANQTTFEYSANGNHGTVGGATLAVHLHLLNTTVGGTPAASLNVIIPGSLVTLSTCSGAYSFRDNGTYGVGVWEAVSGSVVIAFYRADKSNWSASSAATDIRADINLSVQ
jgi:hypothetical protein